jgi:hypothetical protein
MLKPITPLMVICLLLTMICPLRATSAESEPLAAKDKNGTEYETRVYLRRQCLLSEDKVLTDADKGVTNRLFGVLAGIFVPLLIEKVIGGISAALKKAGSEKTLKDSGRISTYLYRLPREEKVILNPDLQCVIVVRGSFTGPDPENPPKIRFEEPRVLLAPTDGDSWKKRLDQNGIPVAFIAAAYEARIKLSDDETALLYESRFFAVNEFQGSRSQDKRSVVISIALSGAGTAEGEPVLSLVMVNLRDVRKGTVLGPNDLKTKRSTWVGGLGMNEASLNALKTLEFPAKPTDPTAPGYKHYLGVMPITVEGVFAETDSGNKALLFIAEVLEATKGDVSKALSSEILERGKRSTEAANALEQLMREEEAAYGEYLDAVAKRCALPEAMTPAAQLRAARFEVERTKNVWLSKFKALAKMGDPPAHQEYDCSST